MSTVRGYGGVPIPGMHRNQTEDTPPADKIRETIRRDEAARADLAARVAHAEIVADKAVEGVARFDWKLNVILGGVAASLVTVIAMAAWTLTSLQKATAETRMIASQESRATTIGVVDEERKRLREEIRQERIESIRALLAEQKRQGTNPDLLTASKAP